jgi:Phage integrase family
MLHGAPVDRAWQWMLPTCRTATPSSPGTRSASGSRPTSSAPGAQRSSPMLSPPSSPRLASSGRTSWATRSGQWSPSLAVGERHEGPILLRRDSQRLDRRTAHRWVRSIGKRAGLGSVHPHMLRAAFIMAALDAGVPLRDVQIAARHADPRTTTIYDRRRQNSTAMPPTSWSPSSPAAEPDPPNAALLPRGSAGSTARYWDTFASGLCARRCRSGPRRPGKAVYSPHRAATAGGAWRASEQKAAIAAATCRGASIWSRWLASGMSASWHCGNHPWSSA